MIRHDRNGDLGPSNSSSLTRLQQSGQIRQFFSPSALTVRATLDGSRSLVRLSRHHLFILSVATLAYRVVPTHVPSVHRVVGIAVVEDTVFAVTSHGEVLALASDSRKWRRIPAPNKSLTRVCAVAATESTLVIFMDTSHTVYTPCTRTWSVVHPHPPLAQRHNMINVAGLRGQGTRDIVAEGRIYPIEDVVVTSSTKIPDTFHHGPLILDGIQSPVQIAQITASLSAAPVFTQSTIVLSDSIVSVDLMIAMERLVQHIIISDYKYVADVIVALDAISKVSRRLNALSIVNSAIVVLPPGFRCPHQFTYEGCCRLVKGAHFIEISGDVGQIVVDSIIDSLCRNIDLECVVISNSSAQSISKSRLEHLLLRGISLTCDSECLQRRFSRTFSGPRRNEPQPQESATALPADEGEEKVLEWVGSGMATLGSSSSVGMVRGSELSHIVSK